MLKRTPFFSHHVEADARIVDFAGWEMPIQYAGVRREHKQVRESVGLFDVSHMGQVRVKGPGAAAALDHLLTNDVHGIAHGEAQYNVMCNEDGGCVDDVFAYRISDHEFLVVVNASNVDKDFAWMVEHNCRDDAEFTNESDDWALLAIQGPNAIHVAGSLTEVPVADLGRRRFVLGTFAGIDGCVMARTGYTGEDGFEIFLPASDAASAWPAILAAGEAYGICPIGLGARDTLRLEARNCLYGHEINDQISPLQARLGWVVKLDKPGGFIGRDAIAARKATDTHWLAGVVLDKRIARDGMTVLRDGVEVGWVASGTQSPMLSRGIALVFVTKPNGRPGTELTIDVRGREAACSVVKGAFYQSNS